MEPGDMSPTFQIDTSPQALIIRRRIGEIVLLHMKTVGLAMLTTGLTLTALTPESTPVHYDGVVRVERVRAQTDRTRSLLLTALTGAATLAIYGVLKAVPDPSTETPGLYDPDKAKISSDTPGIES